jgi:glycosyltransferase involved in cell wall biosynthesis
MGGMERQIISIADGLIKKGHSVTLISLDSSEPNYFYTQNINMKSIPLDMGDPTKKAGWVTRYRRQFRVYRTLKDEGFTTLICFMTGAYWFSVLPARIARVRIILAERNGPSIYWRTRAKKYRWIIFSSMVLSKFITVQFPSYVNSYPTFLRKKIRVVPNVVPTMENHHRPQNEKVRFSFAGRFSDQKNVIELVKGFIEFSKNQKKCSLSLYGEGERWPEVEFLIKESNSNLKINLYGSTRHIEEVFENTDVLIYPSLWEGFPNVVAEALAAGIPVAGLKECEGVRDLICDQKNGWLVNLGTNKVDSIITLLGKVMNDHARIAEFAEESRASIKKYQNNEIYELWSELII